MVREKGKARGRREELKGVRAKGGKEEGLAITPKRNYSYVAFFFLFSGSAFSVDERRN